MKSEPTLHLLHQFCIAMAILIWSPVETLRAQPAAGKATRTSFEDVADRQPVPQQLTFSRRVAQVGDQVRQQLIVEMELDSTVRQAQQVVGESHSESRQRQERIVAALAVENDLMSSARVRYLKSDKETTVKGERTGGQPDPVVGHTYRCVREGEKLVITDDAGLLPSFAEYEIVARSMQGLGRPNPLAVFLSGKTFAIGQQISLPIEVAEQLLGFGEAIGKAEEIELTLDGTKTVGSMPCAVFHVLMEASQHENGQMRLQLEGPMVVEPQTCRLMSVKLQGPLGLAKSVGAAGAAYHMTGTGRLHVSIQAQYADAR